MQHIEQDVRQFVTDNFLFSEPGTDLGNADSFMEKGIIDSMGILTLITFVEQKFGVPIFEEELLIENWDSIDRIATFVRKKLVAQLN